MHRVSIVAALPLMATIAGCAGAAREPAQSQAPATVPVQAASTPPVAEAQKIEPPRAMSPANNQPAAPAEAPPMPKSSMAGTGAGAMAMPATAPTAGAPAPSEPSPRVTVTDLSDRLLATWGSSVCDGFSVPPGTAWAWSLEKKLTDIHGPKVLHASTSGHATDSKESVLERSKVESADFVVVCLSLGNQGLGEATTDARAQAVVDSYVDDIFTDESDSDGDPVSMVNFIKANGAEPIVTLVYPMAGYNKMHCQHVLTANIKQQALGIPTINHLGPSNAGNAFGEADCTWANGRNAPLNIESDARHPNQLGQDELFFAFPPDLPFALASKIAFPVRAETTDYLTLTTPSLEPIRYTPEHALHSYTMQFAFQAASDGTLAAIDLGMNGFLTLELKAGAVHLLTDDGTDVLQGTTNNTSDGWHDVAITYSYVRQKLALYVDAALVGEHAGTTTRELFPHAFVLGGPAASGRTAAPALLQVRDLFINRAPLHAREVEERANTTWIGAGSLDVYAPLRTAAPTENRAQTLQLIKLQM